MVLDSSTLVIDVDADVPAGAIKAVLSFGNDGTTSPQREAFVESNTEIEVKIREIGGRRLGSACQVVEFKAE